MDRAVCYPILRGYGIPSLAESNLYHTSEPICQALSWLSICVPVLAVVTVHTAVTVVRPGADLPILHHDKRSDAACSVGYMA